MGEELTGAGAVCAVCGETPARTVMLFYRGMVREKDLCERHLAELLEGARPEHRRVRPAEDPEAPRRHPSNRQD
jgi:hypothetical protein